MVRFGLQPVSLLPRDSAVQDRLRWTALSSLPDSGRPSDPRQAAEAETGGSYFEWWFKCPRCKSIYLVEAARRFFDATGTAHPSSNQFGRSAFRTCESDPHLLSKTDPGGL